MKWVRNLFPVAGFLLLIGGYSWARWWTTDPGLTSIILQWSSPAASALSLLAVLLLLVVCRSEVLHLIRRLKRYEWLGIAGIVALAMFVRLMFIPATERVYYDEHTYRQIARGIADEGRASVASYGIIHQNHYQCKVGSYPHWPAAWPTLLAGALRLTYYAQWTGFVLNLFLSLTTGVFVALIATLLFPENRIWLAATMLFLCLPANQVWSRTSASEVFAVFSMTLALIWTIRFARRPDWRAGSLMIAAIALATQVRNESIFMLPVYGVFILCLGGSIAAVKALQWPAIILALLLFPQSLHLGHVSRSYQPGIEGAGLDVQHFLSNVTSVPHYLSKEPVALFCLILAIASLFMFRNHKVLLLLWIWGLTAFLPPMFHFGGSYAYPGGERFMLAWAPALCLLAGGSLYILHGKLARWFPQSFLFGVWIVMVVGALVWTAPYIREKDLEYQVPREDCQFLRSALAAVPEDGIVVTADSPLVLAEGRSAVFLPWVGRDMKRLQNLQAQWKDKMYFFVSPSSLPSQWPTGEECERRLSALFQKKVIKQQPLPEGERGLYQLLPRLPEMQ